MTSAIYRESATVSVPKPGQACKKKRLDSRHGLVRGIVVAAALYAGAVAACRADTPTPAAAAAFIEATAHQLITVIDGHEDAASQDRELQAVVDRAVDVEGIARFCMGRYWPLASPTQRQAFLGLFRSVLMDGVTGQIRTYKGVTVTVGRTQMRDGAVSVSSVVLRPGREPAKVDWLVDSTSAGPKIEDVVAEGTSLRLTRRNDYAAYLGSHDGNVDTLLAAMRQRLAQ